LQTEGFNSEGVEGLLSAAGKLVESLVESALFDAAARHVCRISVGRTIDAMLTRYDSAPGTALN
jgi:hypothetical protein